MSKKVIGIAVIAGLDLAFIVLMQAGWGASEVARNIGPPDRYKQSLTQKQSLPELSSPVAPVVISDSDVPVAEEAGTPRVRNLRQPTVQTASHVKKNRRVKLQSFDVLDSSAKLSDTVIYVKRSEPFQFQQQVSYVEPKITTPEPIAEIRPESKRKSFFSKAAPIVKKPYEWLKDLAEKLK